MGAATYFVGELMDELNNELFSCEFAFIAGICGLGLSRSAEHANQYLRAAEVHFESFDGMVYLDSRKIVQISCAPEASAKLNKRL